MSSLVVTKDGYKELEIELKYLQTVKRPKNIEALRDAGEFGDLRENSEYDAAVLEQWQIESRIQEIESILRNAKVVEKVNNEYVHIGSIVSILYLEDIIEEVYKIVGPKEVDILNNKISSESLMGSSLIGKRVGDIVSIKSENIEYKVKIVKLD